MAEGMRKMLIIYPHFPPSNLAGVHRARLIANFLPEFGWHPIVLTVKPEFYEEPLDWDLVKLINPKVEVIYTEARRVPRPRIYGDISLRAFDYLLKKAETIIHRRKIDFIWIPIPPFYSALLGRILFRRTGVPYGIDYIDPWVRNISNRRNWRFIMSNQLAKILEPIAVKKVALISGVAREYFIPMLKRNFKRTNEPVSVAMPYGFDPQDHKVELKNISYPWQGCNCRPLVYAGAFLPMSGYFVSTLFSIIKDLDTNGIMPRDIKLFFLGTGNYTHKSITEYACEAGISDYVVEIRERFPYLHILNFLSAAYGIMVIGSTEEHYTASKIFQSVLSGRPVFSIFHYKSITNRILFEAKADTYLVKYYPNEQNFSNKLRGVFIDFINQAHTWNPDIKALEQYSARESARVLVQAVEGILQNQ